MIRLRDKQGNLLEPNENLGFIEVCDTTGNVACAVYADSFNMIHVITSSSLEKKRYEEIFKVKFSPIVNIPNELKD